MRERVVPEWGGPFVLGWADRLAGAGMRIAKWCIEERMIMKYMLYIIGLIELIAWVACFFLASPGS